MSRFRTKKKPTIKEMTSSILELNYRVNSTINMLSELEKAFSLYIEMMGHNEKFSKYIDKKVKEWKTIKDNDNDTETDGKIDTNDIPTNTKDEGSRTEGIREKAE
jgi:hypothetical protein